MGSASLTRVGRPIFRYHGGKWRLAPWLLTWCPPHRIYCEPFGGGASLLLRKTRSEVEVYNDLDEDVVNVFRVLRDPDAALELERRLRLTPYARAEFRLAHEPADEPIERARRAIVRSVMGFGSAGHGRTDSNAFRLSFTRSGSPALWWAHYHPHVREWLARLEGVIVEHRDWRQVVATCDTDRTLFYVDPPYPAHTRSSLKSTRRRLYRHELTDDDHRALAAALHQVQGMVVLSGYPTPLYDEDLYAGWERHETEVRADRNARRIEVVWLNPAASAALAAARSREVEAGSGAAGPQLSLLEAGGTVWATCPICGGRGER